MDIDLGKSYSRHIIIDNPNRIIYIEVQCNLMGHIKRQELHDLENGLWPQYVPKVYVESIAKAVANGFKVLPMLNQGVKNEGFYIIQMIEVGTNGILQP